MFEKLKLNIRKNMVAYTLILPSIFLLIFIDIVPISVAIDLSFYRYFTMEPYYTPFIGLRNYEYIIFTDYVFSIAIKNTIVWALFVVISSTSLGLITDCIVEPTNQRERYSSNFGYASLADTGCCRCSHMESDV